MRPYRSITGPLILIGIGVIFLLHTIAPDFHIWEFFAEYWPYLLIAWGVLQLVEVLFRTRGPNSAVGLTGGGWFIVILIIVIGTASSQFHHPGNWWQYVGADKSVQMFGNPHDFRLPQSVRPAGKHRRLVIENFRGDAKIRGGEGDQITVNGVKTVRTMNESDARGIDDQTPVEIVEDADAIRIKCHQDAPHHGQVTTNLDIAVPRATTVDANGREGDFDISDLNGTVTLNSDNAGVHVKNVQGDVKVNTHRSDVIDVQQVKGAVTVEGHGDDVNVAKVSGTTSITGDFTGSIRLAQIDKAVRVESLRTHFNAESIPGDIGLARGSLDARNLVGPVKVDTEATDVSVDGIRNSLEINDNRGDIQVRPGNLPLSSIAVHTKSGDIEFRIPQSATFALTASTENGDIDHDLGADFHQQTDGRRAKLEGAVGKGPELVLTTDRGSITVRRSEAKPSGKKAAKSDDDNNDETSEI